MENPKRTYEKQAARLLALKSQTQLLRLLDCKKYQLEELINNPEYVQFTLQKKRGGERNITAPFYPLKIIQQRLNYFLQSVYLLHKLECSHGFVLNPHDCPGRFNIFTNALQHTGRKFVLNMDIENFFPSISAKMVLEIFKGSVFNFSDEIAIPIALLCTYQKSLPVGAPTSPAIANFVCLEVDKELTAYCEAKNITYTRYADDLTFSSDKKFEGEVIDELKNLIEKNKFKLNEKKFRIQPEHRKQVVTGLVVNEKVNVDRRYIRNLRAVIHDLGRNRLHEVVKKHFKINHTPQPSMVELFFRRIKGQINFVGFIRGKDDEIFRKLNDGFQGFVISNQKKATDSHFS